MSRGHAKRTKTFWKPSATFADPDTSHPGWPAFFRLEGVVRRPTCGSENVGFHQTRRLGSKTRHPRQQFSVKVGTIFEDSPIGLDKWLAAMWMIANDKNGISSTRRRKASASPRKTAWFCCTASGCGYASWQLLDKLDGEVEVDETVVGGLPASCTRRALKIKGTGTSAKTAVSACSSATGRTATATVRAKVAHDRRLGALDPEARPNVAAGADSLPDTLYSYNELKSAYTHRVIDHAERYVDGNIHTNGVENFWSSWKRSQGNVHKRRAVPLVPLRR